MAENWLRWHVGTVNDPKWRIIAKRSGQPIHVVLAVWAAMLETACNAVKRGDVSGWNSEDQAAALDLDEAQIEAVYTAMQGKVLDGDRIASWDKRQPKREDNSTDRVRAHRERRNAKERDETQRNGDETLGNARGEEIREEKKESSSTALNSASAKKSATGDDAVAIIREFDESRAAAFGESQARPFPNSTDHLTAKKLIDAGATPAFCRPVFDAVNAKLKAKGHKPRDRLSAMEGDVVSALEARAKPAAKANSAGPAAPRLVGMDERFIQEVTLRLVQKRGGKHGLALQQTYAADPAAGLAEARRLDAEMREEARGAA